MVKYEGKGILITKPNADFLSEEIKKLGLMPYHFPTIQFTSPPDPSHLQNELENLQNYDWMIFVSPQAVQAINPHLASIRNNMLKKIKIAAIGQVTAEFLKKSHLQVHAVPEINWSTEGLLALKEFKELNHSRIAIVRGVGGRETLAKTLRERGAEVHYIEAYQRQATTADPSELMDRITNKKLQIIVATSVTAILFLLQIAAVKKQEILKIAILVSSERIKTLAEDLGFQTIWVAQNASDAAILTAICHFCGLEGNKI